MRNGIKTTMLVVVLVLGAGGCEGDEPVPDGAAWAGQIGGALDQMVEGVAIFSNGDVLAVGSFTGPIEVGARSLEPVGGRDLFLFRYAAGGELRWFRRYGGGEASVGGVAIAESDDIVLVGSFEERFDLGGEVMGAPGSRNGFVARLSPEGDTRWVHHLVSESCDAVAVDESGTIVVAGSAGATGFLAAYSLDGAPLWARSFAAWEDGGVVAPRGVAAGQGQIAMAGRIRGSVDLGDGVGLLAVIPSVDDDGFVAVFEPDGTARWARRLGSAGGALDHTDSAEDVGISDGGRIVVTGRATGVVDFGGESIAVERAAMFVASYSGAGELGWVEVIGGASRQDEGVAVALAPGGEVVVAGHERGDIVVARWSPEGDSMWARSFGGDGADAPTSLALRDDAIVLGATFASREVAFGGTSLRNEGGLDGVVVRLEP